jgi:hypothetical protein
LVKGNIAKKIEKIATIITFLMDLL